MWKPEQRLAAGRGGLRYPSDLNAAKWGSSQHSFRRHGVAGGGERSICDIPYTLYVAMRKAVGREASSTVAVIDSQSAKATQKRSSSIDPQGFDVGKKVTGRKRYILVDRLSLLLSV